MGVATGAGVVGARAGARRILALPAFNKSDDLSFLLTQHPIVFILILGRRYWRFGRFFDKFSG